MSLFPAYSSDEGGSKSDRDRDRSSKWNVQLSCAEEMLGGDEEAAQEAVLLASDSGDDAPPTPPAAPPAAPPALDYYLDGNADNGNLGVTTLYYPGRPIYRRAMQRALGGGAGAAQAALGARRRYYLQPHGAEPAPAPASGAEPEVAERASALRKLLAGDARDEELWLRYIDFQEEWADGAAWRAACEEARARGAQGARVRSALHRARVATLPPRELLAALSAELGAERRPRVRLEAWLRLLCALSGAEQQRAAHAALQDVRSARAYPLVLYVCGAALRAAGLWEQLVLLVELVVAVNFPPCADFPPPPPSESEARDLEGRLQDAEDAVINSGLPLSTVWVRVERLRAAAHWRGLAGGTGGAGGDADPQRAPAAADVQALLSAVRPGAAALALVAVLRLAQVPLLPASEAARRACGAGDAEPADGAGAALCALARARRRLLPAAAEEAPPPGEAPEGRALRAALAALLDPPHGFEGGAHAAWEEALWEACCGWAQGAARLALASWRLRWLGARARAAPAAEARRLVAHGRRVLKRHAAREPLAFAQFARLAADAGDAAEAHRVALQAARAACDSTSRLHALYCARVLRELLGSSSPAAQWALCAAARAHPLPPAAALDVAPPPHELRNVLEECSSRCAELERRFEAEAEAEEETADEVEAESEAVDAAVSRALTCGEGEWAAARVALLAPAAREAELARLLARSHARVHRTGAALQYWEACACALTLEAAREARRADVARQLQPLFPHNALLALAHGGASWWLRGRGSPPAPPRTHTAALALALPPLLRAPLHAGVGAAACGRLARVCARAAARGAGGATLCALRLEAEARSERRAERAHRVLLSALADHPDHKWLYVRGAAWVPAQTEALCDAALERGLRAHALTHELRPLPPGDRSAPA